MVIILIAYILNNSNNIFTMTNGALMCSYSFSYTGKELLISNYAVLNEKCLNPKLYNIFSTEIPAEINHLIDTIHGFSYGDSSIKVINRCHRHGFNIDESDGYGRLLYLYSEVSSNKSEEVVLSWLSQESSKIWVNGNCITVHNSAEPETQFLTANFIKGKNEIVFELFYSCKSIIFSFEICGSTKKCINQCPMAIGQMSEAYPINPLDYICDSVYNTSEPVFNLMFFKNGDDIEQQYLIEVYDSQFGFIESMSGCLNAMVKINLNELRKLSINKFRYEKIKAIFQTKNGHTVEKEIILLLFDVKNDLENILKNAEIILDTIDNEERYDVTGRMSRLKDSLEQNDIWTAFHIGYRLSEILEQKNANIHLKPSKYCDGLNEFFVHSKLDNSIVRLAVRTPKNYSCKNPLPIIVFISTRNESSYSFQPWEKILKEDCLIADVSGRGFTGGGYVGEAAILEAIDYLLNSYNIDEDRIYLAGHSNGGYAVFSLAQNHPSMFAGIYPSVGWPEIGNIANLSNIPTYITISNKDFLFTGKENIIKRKLGNYGNLHQFNFKNTLHIGFVPFMYNRYIYNSILSHKRNLYPNNILFSTERNRYCQSFWVKIHGIKRGCKKAAIKATVENTQSIIINVRGTNGMTVTIPPYIERSSFSVTVNNCILYLKNYNENKLVLTKNKKWQIATEELSYDCRKGTGILDVYLKKLIIVTPTESSKDVARSAAAFASPCTRGIDPKIYINYPIYTDAWFIDNCSIEDDCNIILFDVNNTNKIVDKIKLFLPVKYDIDGYKLNDEKKKTDYLILQVMANPSNNDSTVLVISTNNEKMLNCFFVRNVILPYYSSGTRSYLNNEIVIYDGEKCQYVYEV